MEIDGHCMEIVGFLRFCGCVALGGAAAEPARQGGAGPGGRREGRLGQGALALAGHR